MNRLMLVAPVIAAMLAANVFADDKAGWISMFNGKDLAGWKTNEKPGSFKVEDGAIVVNGPRSHAFYVGDDGKAEFKDFHLKADVMTMPNSNSGIYFHTRFLDEGWPNRGYESQVNNTYKKDPKKTAGLYNVKDNFKAPVGDNEWFLYEIIVEGKRIVVKINGETVTDYTEPDDLVRPDRQLSQGRIALQAHDPGSKVLFKNLKIKSLD